MAKEIRLIPVAGMPEFKPGVHIASEIVRAAQAQDTPLQAKDIVVVTQKVVSKAEGRLVDLSTITPSDLALRWAQTYDRDPRVIEIAMRQSRRISRMDRGVMLTETFHGFYCVNAGVDASNVDGKDMVALLPVDPDASAKKIRDDIRTATNLDVAVIITDTWGRPWREGVTNVAIGSSGIEVLQDYRGMTDPYGYELSATIMAVVDEMAAAAELVMGKLDKVPVAIIRGYAYQPSDTSGVKNLVRTSDMDIFR